MSNSGNNVRLNLPNVTDANLEEAEIGSAPASRLRSAGSSGRAEAILMENAAVGGLANNSIKPFQGPPRPTRPAAANRV